MKDYCVYIMANLARTLYTGVTSNLERRVYEHRQGVVPGFTSQYAVKRLVYFEATPDILAAIAREKQIKGWVRRKKLDLIGSLNPEWQDLAAPWLGEADSSPSAQNDSQG